MHCLPGIVSEMEWEKNLLLNLLRYIHETESSLWLKFWLLYNLEIGMYYKTSFQILKLQILFRGQNLNIMEVTVL